MNKSEFAKELGARAGLTGVQAQKVTDEFLALLTEAIAKGGSTIGDYRQVNGLSGLFQNQFAVYGREGEACRACGSLIRQSVIGGRSSFWCPRCQR